MALITSKVQTSFVGGEISPRMWGRVDVKRYHDAMVTGKNLIVHPHGGCTRRPGLQYMATSHTNDTTRLVPFIYSTTQAYMLEFTHHKIRVFKDGALVTKNGSPVRITTPYDEDDLADLTFCQSADVLYIFGGQCAGDYQPRTLSRSSHTVWTLDTIDFDDGPYLDENGDSKHYLYPSARSGDITLTSNKSIFRSGHEGTRWRILHPGLTVSKKFSRNKNKDWYLKDSLINAAAKPGKGVSQKLATYGTFYVDLTPDKDDGWSGKVTLQRSGDLGKTFHDVAVFTGASSRRFYETERGIFHRLIMKRGDCKEGSCSCKLYQVDNVGIARIDTYKSKKKVLAHVVQRLGRSADKKTKEVEAFDTFSSSAQFINDEFAVLTSWTDADSTGGASTIDTVDAGLMLNGGFETAGGGGADVFANWTESGSGTITRTTTAGEFNGGAAACKLALHADTTELVSNGGFASDAAGWTPDGCTLASVAGGQSGNCLQVTRASGDLQTVTQTISCVVGKTYTVTVYVKSGTSGNEAGILALGDSYVEFTTTAGWVQQTVTYTAEATTMDLVLTKNTSTAGTMLFDTASLLATNLTDYAQVAQTVTVVADTEYTLTYQARGDETYAGQVSIYDLSNSADIVAMHDIDHEIAEFGQFYEHFTTPVGCTSISIRFRSPEAASGGAWACIDDVMMFKDDLPENVTCLKLSSGGTPAPGCLASVSKTFTITQPDGIVRMVLTLKGMFPAVGNLAANDYFVAMVGLGTVGFVVAFCGTYIRICNGAVATPADYIKVDPDIVPIATTEFHNYTFEYEVDYSTPTTGLCNIYYDGELKLSAVPCGCASPFTSTSSSDGVASGISLSQRGETTASRLSYISKMTLGLDFATDNSDLDVEEESPDSVETVTAASAKTLKTNRWSEPAFSDYRGWPYCGCFFQERLMMAGTDYQPQTVNGSASSDFENYAPTTEVDGAIGYTLLSNQMAAIRWMLGRNKLIMGTASGPWILGAEQVTDALSPINVKADKADSTGMDALSPVETGQSILYIQRGKRHLRELTNSFDPDTYVAPDLSVMAEHLFREGIVAIAYQAVPEPIVWLVDNDGYLISMTYERQQEVVAVTWHETDGSFKDVCVIPSTTGGDEVWFVVTRIIGSATKWFVERMADPLTFKAAGTYCHVDSCVTYSGAAITSLGGFDHLKGETVRVYGDGEVLDDVTVNSAGTILLRKNGVAESCTKVFAGLGFDTECIPLRPVLADIPGGGQAQVKKIIEVALRCHGAMRGKVGPVTWVTGTKRYAVDSSLAKDIVYRADTGVPLSGDQLNYGDIKMDMPLDYETDGLFGILCDTAAPFTLHAIESKVLVGDDLI